MEIFSKVLAFMLVGASAFAADKPDLKVANEVSKLAVSFVDADVWNGKRWLRVQQCAGRGGVAPLKSPALKVSGAPTETQKLVVFFSNPRAMHNHGLFSYQAKPDGDAYTVPAVASGATAKLPEGIALFQGGSTWSAAFNAACPSGGSWKYSVTVYALDAQEQVIAMQEIDVGWAE